MFLIMCIIEIHIQGTKGTYARYVIRSYDFPYRSRLLRTDLLRLFTRLIHSRLRGRKIFKNLLAGKIN